MANKITDEQLLSFYKNGWNDSADGKQKLCFENEILQRAYDIGWFDFIAGDDVSSVDLQTSKDILMHIKQHWKKPAIKSSKVTCVCCNSTDEVLALDTLLYMGFGGWNISKNGEPFFVEENNVEFENSKTLSDVEEMIGEDDESEYLAVLFSPLLGATYQRHSKNHWVLIEEDDGFA